MSTTFIPMRVDVAGTVHVARNQNWSIERLNQCMPSVPPEVVAKLLDCTADIAEQFDNGSFNIKEKIR